MKYILSAYADPWIRGAVAGIHLNNSVSREEYHLLRYKRRVVSWVSADVSEEHIASIFRVEKSHLLSHWFLLSLFFRPWRWRRYVPPKCRLTPNGLHGVISQKMGLFITTAVRTSNQLSLDRNHNLATTADNPHTSVSNSGCHLIDFCFGGPGFKSRPSDLILSLRSLVVSLSSCRHPDNSISLVTMLRTAPPENLGSISGTVTVTSLLHPLYLAEKRPEREAVY
jgi:hypothetical protein